MAAEGLGFLASTFPDFFALLVLAVFIWLLSSSILWTEIAWRKHHAFIAAGIGWLTTLSVIGGLGWYLGYLQQSNSPSFEMALMGLPVIVIAGSVFSGPQIWVAWLVVFLALGWSWGYSIKHAPNPRAATKLGWLITALAFSLLFLGWLPFVLWAFGIIPLYETALALSSVLIAILLWRTWPKIISLRRQALVPQALKPPTI